MFNQDARTYARARLFADCELSWRALQSLAFRHSARSRGIRTPHLHDWGVWALRLRAG